MDQEYQSESFFSKIRSNAAEFVEFIAILGVIILIVYFVIAEAHVVSGNSMLPNFHNGEYVITNKLALRLAELQRGEVIIFKSPIESNKVYIKRVLALPKERIKILSNTIFINGTPLNEPYLPSGVITQMQGYAPDGDEVLVPEGSYFVVGDNRQHSSDSREWGPLKKELIIGQAWLRYWPLDKIGLIPINQATN